MTKREEAAQPLAKVEGDQDLTYSKTNSLLSEDFLPLLKRVVALLGSKEHIANHVQHSLEVKGFQRELSREIGSVIGQSFGEYVNIAQALGCKIAKEEFQDNQDDQILAMNHEIAALKLENATQFQKITIL